MQHCLPYADEMVCLSAPEPFYAVGQFYPYFPQVSDEEVIKAAGYCFVMLYTVIAVAYGIGESPSRLSAFARIA